MYSMPDPVHRFRPGTLWSTLVDRARLARQTGALQPIATDSHTISEHGVRFQARIVSSLARKQAQDLGRAAGAAAPSNPFLPYEKDLYVADVSDTHLCLLNKYNVIDHHLLIVTRNFERQERALTRADFEALSGCLAEFDALGFYNSGPVAGASQPHKHLQLVPLPLGGEAPAIPIEPLLASPASRADVTRVAQLPFRHAFSRLDPVADADPLMHAAFTHKVYVAMLSAVGFDPALPEPPPYNLLVTRRYMLLIPRTRDRFGTVPVNALGFAGSFFVPDTERLEAIRRAGPMTVLRGVAISDQFPGNS